jgi:hypothetical protein
MVSMGLEAECTVRVGRKTSTGKALLETETLIFRGEFSLQIAFGAMRDLSVEGNALVVKTDDQEARFELGAPVADRWMRLIKEPRTLFEKLDLRPDMRVAAVDVRDSFFLTALRERVASVAEGRVPEGVPVVFFGAETRDGLRMIQLLRARMIDAGVLWVIRPKGSPAIAESDVFEAVHGAGLVDTKVVSFSKTHTAHKCVIPVDQRGAVRRRPPIMSIPPSAPQMEPKKAKTSSRPAPKATKATKPAKAAKAPKPAKPVKPAKVAKATKPTKAPKSSPASKSGGKKKHK